jgi:p-aminobenzoyl-glutamate transporter AbgT
MVNKVDLKIDNHGSKTTKTLFWYITMVFKKLRMVSSFEITGIGGSLKMQIATQSSLQG